MVAVRLLIVLGEVLILTVTVGLYTAPQWIPGVGDGFCSWADLNMYMDPLSKCWASSRQGNFDCNGSLEDCGGFKNLSFHIWVPSCPPASAGPSNLPG